MLRWEEVRSDLWFGWLGEEEYAAAISYRASMGFAVDFWLDRSEAKFFGSLEEAKASAESHLLQWLDRAKLPSGDFQDGYRAGLEAAAELVANKSVVYRVVGGVTVGQLRSPYENDRAGTAYAHAIRNLAGVSSPTSTPRVPEGWRLVPVEPTEEMLRAAQTAYDRKAADMYSPTPTEEYEAGGGPFGYAWHAMCSAAPKPEI